MVYSVFMQRLDQYSNNLLFEVFDTHGLVATIKKDIHNVTQLNFHNNAYLFPFSIRAIEKVAFPFEFPVSSKGKTKLGYEIKRGGKRIAEYYGETAIVEKKKLFSKKMGFEVFKYDDAAYLIFKIGFAEEKSHYYCAIDAITGCTVGIIERMQGNKEEVRSKIYFIEQDKVELMLMLLATEMVMNVTSNSEGQVIDPSAGNYISIRKEEKNYFDRVFLELAKQN